MAFTSALLSEGKLERETNRRLYYYRTTDTIATVTGAGYFAGIGVNGSNDRSARLGDVIDVDIVDSLSSPTALTPYQCRISSIDGSANATVAAVGQYLLNPTIILTPSVSPSPTVEGQIEWDSDDDQIKVGDGSSTLTFSDDTRRQAQAAILDAITSAGQQSAISDPSGGSTIDAEARTAINAIIDALQALGLVST